MSLLEEFISNTSVQEMIMRSAPVLIVAEGLRIAFRACMYQFSKKTKKQIHGLSEIAGIMFTVFIAIWMTFIYTGPKSWFLIISEGIFYGFTTVFIHWIFIKYLDKKIYKGVMDG